MFAIDHTVKIFREPDMVMSPICLFYKFGKAEIFHSSIDTIIKVRRIG